MGVLSNGVSWTRHLVDLHLSCAIQSGDIYLDAEHRKQLVMELGRESTRNDTAVLDFGSVVNSVPA